MRSVAAFYVVVAVALQACAPGSGTLVLGWRSEEPAGTLYDVRIDGDLAHRLSIKSDGTADVKDRSGRQTKLVGPLQIHLDGKRHHVEIMRNGVRHWSKTIVVGEPETEFYYSLSDPDGESPEVKARQ